ncbi:MAG: DUF4143 domain-containing protein [Bacteroidales bacterium]|nr:DUF4143 domain-containing protein [Bacteroidales bacterium]
MYENYIISDLVKENYNQGMNLKFYFWRDNHNNEIDLLIDSGTQKKAVEIKSGETFRNDFIKNLSF